MVVTDKQRRSKVYKSVIRDAKRKFKVYPSRWAGVWISKEFRRRSSKSKSRRRKSGGGAKRYTIPMAVQNAAIKGLELKKLGFAGGTETGHKRARQLARGGTISENDLRVMRAWFARHDYTSKPGYKSWVRAGRPKDDPEYKRKGSIYAWLAWGGDPAQRWVNNLAL